MSNELLGEFGTASSELNLDFSSPVEKQEETEFEKTARESLEFLKFITDQTAQIIKIGVDGEVLSMKALEDGVKCRHVQAGDKVLQFLENINSLVRERIPGLKLDELKNLHFELGSLKSRLQTGHDVSLNDYKMRIHNIFAALGSLGGVESLYTSLLQVADTEPTDSLEALDRHLKNS